MERIVTMRPRLGQGWVVAISSVTVAAVIGAGTWVVLYGLPKWEAANWGVLGVALVLVIGAVVAWKYVDMKRVGIVQRCLIISVLVHVLIATGFSKLVREFLGPGGGGGDETATPNINVNLSNELAVREQVRQQVSVDLPVQAPMPSLVRQDEESPLPEMKERIEPVGIAGMEWMQVARQQALVAPTVTMAPPAPELVTPLMPVRPEIVPLPVVSPVPIEGGVDSEKEWSRVPGPVEERLAPKAESLVPGSGAGSPGAPPSKLDFGTKGGGSETGSGTERSLTLLAAALPPRMVDLPIPTVAPPPPSSVELVGPLGPGQLDALGQRAFDQRQKMLEKYGGNHETEAAVARALLYLSRVQGNDGHWSKVDQNGGSKGNDEHDGGLTGLAVLCYLAANHTPDQEGAYKEVVRKGINYLMVIEKADGDMRNGGNMYDHAIGALALGEAAAMIKDRDLQKKVREAAHRAAQFCLDAQNSAGAWRYEPKDWFTDTSVTGWQVMALHSAERTGFKVKDETKLQVLKFLGSVSKGDNGMLSGYLSASPTLTMTAEGMFTRMLVGQRLSDGALKEAAGYLENPKSEGFDYYYVYYGSMALMQMQGEAWARWNPVTSKMLIALQEKAGAETGSFPVIGEWGAKGGKVYCTALSTLSLEVYYRYLPMYAR